jgi:predicted DNA-binding transcriptional regulator YafY
MDRRRVRQSLEEQEDGGVVLKMTVAGEGDLFRRILIHGSHVEVLAPEWLRERVVEEWRWAVELTGCLRPNRPCGL